MPCLRFVLFLALLAGTSGCDLTASDTPDLAGLWTGSALLPNGFSASADLSQSGTTVGGTLRISGVFNPTDFSGDIDDLGRLSWTLQSGCGPERDHPKPQSDASRTRLSLAAGVASSPSICHQPRGASACTPA